LPKVDGIPFKTASARVVAGHQFFPRCLSAKTPALRVAQRNVDLPKVVVEIEVKQGTVHVEQNGIDA
jgi:hypothetical protein